MKTLLLWLAAGLLCLLPLLIGRNLPLLLTFFAVMLTILAYTSWHNRKIKKEYLKACKEHDAEMERQLEKMAQEGKRFQDFMDRNP